MACMENVIGWNFRQTRCFPFYSDPGCLALQGPISIIDQPDDVVEHAGDDVTFAIDVLNSSLDYNNDIYIQYKWEESADNGVTWTNLNQWPYSRRRRRCQWRKFRHTDCNGNSRPTWA